jgi:hypothetical protein
MPLDPLTIIGYITGMIGFIATLVSAAVIVRATAVQQTIKLQKGLIDTLLEKVDLLEKGSVDNKARLESLEHELEIVKTLPLGTIITTQADIQADTKKIIELLKKNGAKG